MSRWNNINEKHPPEGIPVIVALEAGHTDSSQIVPGIACYCDGGWYRLAYDNVLGTLRKQYVDWPIHYWTKCIMPDMTDVTEKILAAES